MLSNARYTLARTEDTEGAEMFFGWCVPMNVVQCEIHFGSHRGYRAHGVSPQRHCMGAIAAVQSPYGGYKHRAPLYRLVTWQAREIPRNGCRGNRHGMTLGSGALPTSFIPIQYPQKSCHPPPSRERRGCGYRPAAQSPCRCGVYTSSHATDR